MCILKVYSWSLSDGFDKVRSQEWLTGLSAWEDTDAIDETEGDLVGGNEFWMED